MKNRIFFYGSLPLEGKPPFGGGEIGNMRTIRMLESGGYEVVQIRHRKAPANAGNVQKLVSYPIRLFFEWFEVLGKLLFASRKSLVHFSGFAGATVFNEYVLVHLIKLLGFQVLYELRGGGAIQFWEQGSAFYRRMFRYILNSACQIFIQGKENIPLISSISEVPVYHYPNCVEDGFIPHNLPPKPKDRINLVFYGRVEENKHVNLIVEITALVQKELKSTHLTIVGDGQKKYLDNVKKSMKSLLIPGSYNYLQGCKHEDLPSLLVDKHFYIFPSTQPREGQSNSVTECMGFGIIPIASPQGFNRSTIGDDYLIIDYLTAEQYANRIVEIVKHKQFDKLSAQMQKRFRENYTQDIVFMKTLNVYRSIIEI